MFEHCCSPHNKMKAHQCGRQSPHLGIARWDWLLGTTLPRGGIEPTLISAATVQPCQPLPHAANSLLPAVAPFSEATAALLVAGSWKRSKTLPATSLPSFAPSSLELLK